MSARAWVLFLCFSTLLASAASAVTAVAAAPSRPDDRSQAAQARLSWDAEQQICRLLWLAGP